MGLEGIRRVQRNIESADAKAANKDPLTGEQMELGEHDRSPSDVFQDPEEHKKFVSFLNGKDARRAKAIIEAHADGREWTDAQNTFLDKSLGEYNLRRAEMSRLREAFSLEYIRNIADTDKKIGFIVKKIGLERAHNLLAGQFENLGYENDKEFKKIVKSMIDERAVSESTRAREANTKVEAALKRIGLSEAELGTMVKKSMSMTSGFDAGEQAELTRVAKEKMGTLMTLADVISGSAISHRRTRGMIAGFQEQRDLLRQSNIHLADIGKALYATITPEQRLEMQRVVVEGGEMKELPETNVNTIPEYKEARDAHTQAEREKRFKDHMKAELKKLKKGPGAASPAEKDKIKDDFVENEFGAQEKRKGRGIFAALLALIFKTKADLRSEVDTIWP